MGVRVGAGWGLVDSGCDGRGGETALVCVGGDGKTWGTTGPGA